MNKTDLSILIADDDAISLCVLKEYLLAAGYKIVIAEDGQQAWDLLVQAPENFALVIIDRIMPHLHGLDVVKRMQNNPLLKKTPAIMVTGVADKEEIVAALKAGVFDFLHKPIERELLLAVVKRALQHLKN